MDDDMDPLAMMGGMAEEHEAEESEWMKEQKTKATVELEEAEAWLKSNEELGLKQGPKNRTYKGLEYENQGTWKKPFFFVQMADTQFGMLGGGRRGLEEEEAMCNLAVEHIN